MPRRNKTKSKTYMFGRKPQGASTLFRRIKRIAKRRVRGMF